MSPRPPLYSDDVLAVVRTHAAVPLTTAEVARHTRLTYPAHADVTTDTVRGLLWYLVRRERVVSYPWHDADSLADRGVTAVQGRSRYWALPLSTSAPGSRA
jgi:hypothetical protein